MKKLALAIAGLSLSATVHAADTIDLTGGTLGGLTPAQQQATFKTILGDMGGAFNFKALNPAEPQGLIGFDVSANLTYAAVSDEEAWRTATGEDIEQIGSVGAKISKGLPFGVDVSGFYNIVPGTDASFYGAALSYAIEEGGIISPALAIRLGYTKGEGIEDFDFDTKSIDLSISKGFAMVTPYAGIGQVFITGTPTASAPPTIEEEDFSETRVLAGVKINFGMQLVLEAEKTGDIETFSARIGFGL